MKLISTSFEVVGKLLMCEDVHKQFSIGIHPLGNFGHELFKVLHMLKHFCNANFQIKCDSPDLYNVLRIIVGFFTLGAFLKVV